MNEEEQKAIEDLRGYLEWNDKNSFSRLPRDNHIETVLNLISKLQKEIEERDKKIKYKDNIIQSLGTEVLPISIEGFEVLLNKTKEENKRLQKELDKKDKVIDKMAKTIAGLQLYDFNRKEYFTLENEGEVREYFYKKVEEENEPR